MDRRSFDLNFENNILFHDADLTQAIRRRQSEYVANSRLISRAEVAAWSLPYRLRNNLMATFSPLL